MASISLSAEAALESVGLKSIIVYASKASSNSLVLQTSPQRSSRMPRNRKKCCSKLRAEMTVRLSIVYGSLKISSDPGWSHQEVQRSRRQAAAAELHQPLQGRHPVSFGYDHRSLSSARTPAQDEDQGLGSVESELLCRCFFDLYIGDERFDKSGRAAMAVGLKTRHGCILAVEKRITSTLLEPTSVD